MSKKKGNKKNQGTSNTNIDKRAAKKAAVLGTDKKSRLPAVAIIVVLALSIAGGAFLVTQKGEEGSVAPAPQSSTGSATEVAHPVSLFDDGRARHFQYRTNDGLTVKYFVLKSSDGVIRAAFDACDVCWKAGKGYYQQGDFMVCVNCGRKFASVLVNEVKGGCNPAPLNRTIVDGKVVIAVTDILDGRTYFDFSKGV